MTIFTVPRPFKGVYDILQRNAIESWMRECPNSKIILVGDEKGIERVASEYSLGYISNIKTNSYGTPLLNSIVSRVRECTEDDTLCLINTDIILVGDLEEIVEETKKNLPKFLMVAQRYDSEIKERISFSPDWRESILQKRGKLRGRIRREKKISASKAGGADLFVWKRGLYDNTPPFAFGRWFWDGWMMYRAFMRKVPIVDVTQAISLIHQAHPTGSGEEKLKEKEVNRKLCTGKKHSRDAIYTFTKGGLKPQKGISIISFPRPFLGEYRIIQRNSIKSWMKCCPNSQIMLLGDEEGVSKTCREFGLEHIPRVKKNPYGTPYVDEIFNRGQRFSEYGVVCYVNTDIIFCGEVEEIVWEARKRFREFLLVGRRHDLKVERELHFHEGWQDRIKKVLQEKGKLHHAGGVDYFIFTHNLFPPQIVPPFLLGRMEWDGWLVWSALKREKPVVEITDVLTAIHQTHTKIEECFDEERLREEKEINKELCMGTARIVQSTHVFTKNGIKERENGD